MGSTKGGVETARELHVPGPVRVIIWPQVRVMHVPGPGTCHPESDILQVRVIYTYLSGT